MISQKRIFISIILGLLAGGICIAGAILTNRMEFTPALIFVTIFMRVLTGFTIGITGWDIPPWLRGMIIGLLFSLPIAAFSESFDAAIVFIAAGAVYGLLIDLLLSKMKSTKVIHCPEQTGVNISENIAGQPEQENPE